MWPLFALVLGLVVGSFLNVVIRRLPRGESLAYPPSYCPACGHSLGPLDLIPVLSYLALRGRCRYCQSPISPRYPLVEAITGFLFLLAALFYPPSPMAFSVFAFLAFLVALAFIDLDTYELPDALTYGLLFLGLAASYFLAFPLPFRESLDGALMAAGGLGLVAGYGGLFLRRLKEMEAKEVWVTWIEVLRGIKVRNGLEETLADIFPPRPFSDMGAIIAKVKKALPDLPEDTSAEVGKLAKGGLEIWRLEEDGEAELHVPLPVGEPNLGALLGFLGRVGQPGEAIILREVKRLYKPGLNEGVRMKIAGWLIEEKGVRPLELGFLDPATGKFWEVNPYTYLPV